MFVADKWGWGAQRQSSVPALLRPTVASGDGMFMRACRGACKHELMVVSVSLSSGALSGSPVCLDMCNIGVQSFVRPRVVLARYCLVCV